MKISVTAPAWFTDMPVKRTNQIPIGVVSYSYKEIQSKPGVYILYGSATHSKDIIIVLAENMVFYVNLVSIDSNNLSAAYYRANDYYDNEVNFVKIDLNLSINISHG